MKGNFIIRFLINKIVAFLGRHPWVLMASAIIYIISPFDLLPEAFTGLIGYFDDVLALIFTSFMLQHIKKKRTSFSSSDPTDSKNPYDVLEIKKGASPEEIKIAYRKKMADYHPDKVAHLGEDLKKTAHEKTLEIQQAYEALKK